MSLRLIEMFLPEDKTEEVQELLKERSVLNVWHDRLSEKQILFRIILAAEEVEAVLDLLEKRFSGVEGFRIILLSVEATIPRPEPEEKAEPEQAEPEIEKPPEPKLARISREELYSDIIDTTKLSTVYVVMVVLSAIVAAIGIMRGNVAVIIGAMVIAPLLGPNVALSLATTLGDIDLARKALKANVMGIITALVIAVFIGFTFTVDIEVWEISSRTKVVLGDIALALAAGSAGALSFTTGLPTALIGVMVAVALLPPLVTFGLLLGAGHWVMALGAMLLFLTNLICINLAGVVTFLVQGIRPLTWWEADRAKKASRLAIMLWIVVLLALVLVIVLSQSR